MLHHGAGLRRLLTVKKVSEVEQDRLVDALTREHQSAEIADADRAMLDYARKLTLTPAAIDAADVDELRTQGFDDRGIHDICSITAYFGFVNRIADGLGVDVEERFDGKS